MLFLKSTKHMKWRITRYFKSRIIIKPINKIGDIVFLFYCKGLKINY